MGNDVIHGKDTLRYAFFAYDRKAPHLLFGHSMQGFMNFIVRPAREYVLCGDLSDGEFSRQAISGSYGDADISVGHHSQKFPVIPDDRQHAAVAYPQELDCRTHICIRVTT